MRYGLIPQGLLERAYRVTARAAAALKPGGVMVIGEALRPPAGSGRQLGAFFDLYFGLTSESGT